MYRSEWSEFVPHFYRYMINLRVMQTHLKGGRGFYMEIDFIVFSERGE